MATRESARTQTRSPEMHASQRMRSRLKPGDVKRFGFTQVWHSIEEPLVDIIFVHGLDGHPYKSWQAPGSDGTYWPGDLLPHSLYGFPVRILTYGYDANLWGLTNGSAKDGLMQYSRTLVSELTANRRRYGCTRRPIVFVCHSLGGLLVKSALIFCANCDVKINASNWALYTSTHGICFLATPHHGSRLARWGVIIQSVGALVFPRRYGLSSDVLSSLQENSATLVSLDQEFRKILSKFRLAFFYEMLPTSLAGTKKLVVDIASACPPDLVGPHDYGGISADHQNICCFRDPDAPGYAIVSDAIVRFCEEAPKAITLAWEKAIKNYPSYIPEHEEEAHSPSPSPTRGITSNQLVFLPSTNEEDGPSFGRATELAELCEQLLNSKRSAVGTPSVLLYADSGFGKSHLARHYISQYSTFYRNAILWVNARSLETCANDYMVIAQQLLQTGLAKKVTFDATDKRWFIQVVKGWLESRGDWLLVFDGIAFGDRTLKVFKGFLPSRSSGNIIYTAREKSLENKTSLFEPHGIRVGPLDKDAGMQLLYSQMQIETATEDQEQTIGNIVEHYQGHPLSIKTISRLVKDSGSAVENSRSLAALPKTVYDIYSEMLARLERQKEVAELLTVLSFFCRQIPLSIIFLGASMLRNAPLESGRKAHVNGHSFKELLYTAAHQGLADFSRALSLCRSKQEAPCKSHTCDEAEATSDMSDGEVEILNLSPSVQEYFKKRVLADDRGLSWWLCIAIMLFKRAYLSTFHPKRATGHDTPARPSDMEYWHFKNQASALQIHLTSGANGNLQRLGNDLKILTAELDECVEQRLSHTAVMTPESSSLPAGTKTVFSVAQELGEFAPYEFDGSAVDGLSMLGIGPPTLCDPDVVLKEPERVPTPEALPTKTKAFDTTSSESRRGSAPPVHKREESGVPKTRSPKSSPAATPLKKIAQPRVLSKADKEHHAEALPDLTTTPPDKSPQVSTSSGGAGREIAKPSSKAELNDRQDSPDKKASRKDDNAADSKRKQERIPSAKGKQKGASQRAGSVHDVDVKVQQRKEKSLPATDDGKEAKSAGDTSEPSKAKEADSEISDIKENGVRGAASNGRTSKTITKNGGIEQAANTAKISIVKSSIPPDGVKTRQVQGRAGTKEAKGKDDSPRNVHDTVPSQRTQRQIKPPSPGASTRAPKSHAVKEANAENITWTTVSGRKKDIQSPRGQVRPKVGLSEKSEKTAEKPLPHDGFPSISASTPNGRNSLSKNASGASTPAKTTGSWSKIAGKSQSGSPAAKESQKAAQEELSATLAKAPLDWADETEEEDEEATTGLPTSVNVPHLRPITKATEEPSENASSSPKGTTQDDIEAFSSKFNAQLTTQKTQSSKRHSTSYSGAAESKATVPASERRRTPSISKTGVTVAAESAKEKELVHAIQQIAQQASQNSSSKKGAPETKDGSCPKKKGKGRSKHAKQVRDQEQLPILAHDTPDSETTNDVSSKPSGKFERKAAMEEHRPPQVRVEIPRNDREVGISTRHQASSSGQRDSSDSAQFGISYSTGELERCTDPTHKPNEHRLIKSDPEPPHTETKEILADEERTRRETIERRVQETIKHGPIHVLPVRCKASRAFKLGTDRTTEPGNFLRMGLSDNSAAKAPDNVQGTVYSDSSFFEGLHQNQLSEHRSREELIIKAASARKQQDERHYPINSPGEAQVRTWIEQEKASASEASYKPPLRGAHAERARKYPSNHHTPWPQPPGYAPMNMPVTGIPPPPYHGSMNTNPAEMVTGHPPPPLYRSVAGALPSRPPVSMATDFSDVSTARVQPPPYVVPQITPIPGVTPTQPPEGLITIPPGLTPAGLQTPTYRPQAAPAPQPASSLTSHMASQLAPGEAPRVLSDDYDIVLVPKRRGQAPGSSQGNQEVYGPTYEASPLALPPHAPANLPAPMAPRHGYPPFTQQTSLANPPAPAMMQQGYPPVTQQPALTPQPLPPGHGGDLGLPMQPTAGGPMYPYPEPSQAEQGPPPVAPPAPPQAPETPYTLTESSSETGQKSG